MIMDVLNKISFTMILDEDVIVYRSILVDKNKKIEFIDDSPSFISTSIKIEDAEIFLDGDDTEEKHFYRIKLAKGIPVIVSPFSVVRKYDSFGSSLLSENNYSLAVSNRGISGRQEIILFKDYISFKEISNKIICDELGSIYLHSVEIDLKKNIYINDESKFK